MSYTATFDASHKVKASGAHSTNFARHIARDADLAAGFTFVQRNPNIDPARTSMNITMINDGYGGWRAPVVTQDAEGKDRPPSAEIGDYLDARLGTVKRKLRTDAVVMRPMILQLDPEWFAEHNPNWQQHGLNAEAEKYIGAQLDWAGAEFGQENLPGYSVHMDETSPQLQLLFTPVTEDGRLSQKDFFKGPRDLNRQHDEYRHALADAGYEVDFKVTQRSKEHLSSAEFAMKADQARVRAAEAEQHLATVRQEVEQSDFGEFFEQQYPEEFSQLLDEYTNEMEQRIRKQKEQEHGQHHRAGHGQGDGEDRAAADFGDVGDVELDSRRRRAAAHDVDEGREGPHRASADLGQGADESDRQGVDLAAVRRRVAADREDRELRLQAGRDREHPQRVRKQSRREAVAERFAESDRRSAEKSDGIDFGD